LIIGTRRAVLIGVIVAVALAIILYPLITFTPIDLNAVTIQLAEVSLASGSSQEQSLDLKVVFRVNNTSDITLTTSRIDYELFADGVSLDSDTLSYEDIPLNGRPQLFPGGSVPLTRTFHFQFSDARAEVFDKILNNGQEIEWSVKGTIEVESALTVLPKNFTDEL
jgi:LEA14-like dessication related protein